MQRADPFICRQDNGKYYFTASVPAYDRIILRCADTLAGIADAEEATIWHKHESGPMSENIWAPYCMGMLTADSGADLLDPLSWKKERYPVLASDPSIEVYGPGHNSFTVDEEGNDILVYHARKESVIEGDPLYNPNRHTMLMKVRWENGRPVFDYKN